MNLSVCFFHDIIFEWLRIETSFLVCAYIITISKSTLSIKAIGSRSRSYYENDHFTYFNMLILCMWLQVINEVKVMHEGEGSIKVKVQNLPPNFMVSILVTFLL